MKQKQFLTILIAVLMSLSIAQWALAAEEELATTGPASAASESEGALAELLADIEADKSAVVGDLVDRFAIDDASAYQLESTLAVASAATLAEIDLNADSLEAVSAILAGPEDIERVGDLTRDYTYTPITPCRIVNTTIVGGPFFPGQVRDYFVYGPGPGATGVAQQGGNPAGCNSPNGEPRAVHINITAVPVAGTGNFRAYPASGGAPNASHTNYRAGVQNVANAGTIATFFSFGPRELRVLNSFGTANLVIDVLGYYHQTENLAGADFASGDQVVSLVATDTTVRSVTISAPASGRVIVNASGYFSLNSAAVDTGRCSITTGTALDFTHLIITGERTGTAMTFIPFGATRGFNVGAGNTTFRLVCNEFAGTVTVSDTSLTATWVPRSY
jgi:hypothetical protein